MIHIGEGEHMLGDTTFNTKFEGYNWSKAYVGVRPISDPKRLICPGAQGPLVWVSIYPNDDALVSCLNLVE